jgi:hypothetical protein
MDDFLPLASGWLDFLFLALTCSHYFFADGRLPAILLTFLRFLFPSFFLTTHCADKLLTWTTNWIPTTVWHRTTESCSHATCQCCQLLHRTSMRLFHCQISYKHQRNDLLAGLDLRQRRGFFSSLPHLVSLRGPLCLLSSRHGGGGEELGTDLHVVPRLIMRGALPPLLQGDDRLTPKD